MDTRSPHSIIQVGELHPLQSDAIGPLLGAQRARNKKNINESQQQDILSIRERLLLFYIYVTVKIVPKNAISVVDIISFVFDPRGFVMSLFPK